MIGPIRIPENAPSIAATVSVSEPAKLGLMPTSRAPTRLNAVAINDLPYSVCVKAQYSEAIASALADRPQRAAMDRLIAAWQAARLADFDAAMAILADSIVRIASTREMVDEAASLLARLRGVGAAHARALQHAVERVAVAQRRRQLHRGSLGGLVERADQIVGRDPASGGGPQPERRDRLGARLVALADLLVRRAGERGIGTRLAYR